MWHLLLINIRINYIYIAMGYLLSREIVNKDIFKPYYILHIQRKSFFYWFLFLHNNKLLFSSIFFKCIFNNLVVEFCLNGIIATIPLLILVRIASKEKRRTLLYWWEGGGR